MIGSFRGVTKDTLCIQKRFTNVQNFMTLVLYPDFPLVFTYCNLSLNNGINALDFVQNPLFS